MVQTAGSTDHFLSELSKSFHIFSYSGEIIDASRFEIYPWYVRRNLNRYLHKNVILFGEILDSEKRLIRINAAPSLGMYILYWFIFLVSIFFTLFHPDGIMLLFIFVPLIILILTSMHYSKKRMLRTFIKRFNLKVCE